MIDQSLNAEQRASKAAKDFANAVNEMGFRYDIFAAEFRCQHRTLQQNGMRAIVEIIRQLADDRKAGFYDLRNDDATALAKLIIASIPEEKFYLRHV